MEAKLYGIIIICRRHFNICKILSRLMEGRHKLFIWYAQRFTVDSELI